MLKKGMSALTIFKNLTENRVSVHFVLSIGGE